MAFFHESEASPFVHIQIRKDILQHVDDATLVMHHLFQGYQVGVYLRNPGIHFTRDFKTVT